LLQGDAGKIAITRDFSALQLAPDAPASESAVFTSGEV
jgi:hypothetical protein